MKFRVLIGACVVALVAAAGEPSRLPFGWFTTGYSQAAQKCVAMVDSNVVSQGKRSLVLRCDHQERDGFGVQQQFSALDYRGQRVRFSASVRSDSLSDWGGLWMRIDGEHGMAFDNMKNRPVKGSAPWQRVEVVLNVASDATLINFGMQMIGAGAIWMDDIKFERVEFDVPITGADRPGKPVGQPYNLDLSQ
jgi:hypothetical protein